MKEEAKHHADFARLLIGEDYPTRVMGVINVSPESFYSGSVIRSDEILRRAAEKMEAEGADIIDVGAMSTAPYIDSEVSESVEIDRMRSAITAIRPVLKIPISVDTVRSKVAAEGIRAGADVVNDVSGLSHDSEMCKVVSTNKVGIVIMAFEESAHLGIPMDRVVSALAKSVQTAKENGIADDKIVVDPGIGFFRREGRGYGFSPEKEYPWYIWDSMIVRDLSLLRNTLRRPTCVGVSRKSFIGKITRKEAPEERLAGSIAASAIAVYNGADMIRTHDVSETIQAVSMARAIRNPESLRAEP